MIVCVLLVSNSFGCCLGALGDHGGAAARVIAPRRDNTRGSLTPTIHTQSCLISIRTWCHHCFHSYQYSAHKKQFKVWIENNRSLCCHVTTLSWWQVLQSSPSPVAKMRMPIFAGDWACEINCARPASSAFHGDNEVDHVVCLKAEIQLHAVLSNENGKFYTTMIYPCFSRSVYFSMGLPAWWRFGLCSGRSSPESRWRDVTLVREFQMWRRRCKQINSHWFQGRQMRFWWTRSTISWKYLMIYPVRLFSTANF